MASNEDMQFGVVKSGLIVWQSAIRETITNRRAGKGATIKETKYFVDAAWVVCQGPADILRVWFNATELVLDLLPRADGTTVTGEIDPTMDSDSPINIYDLPDPSSPAGIRLFGTRFNGTPTLETLGSGNTLRAGRLTIKDGGSPEYRTYPGTLDQPVDPTIDAEITARKGASGYTPAYRDRALFVVKDIPLSVLGNALPNATFLVRNTTYRTVKSICEDLARRAGLEESQYDFSAYGERNVRGMIIPERRGPRDDMEILARCYGLDAVEFDGVITGILKGGTVAASIPETMLGASADDKFVPRVEVTIPDSVELPKSMDLTYFQTGKMERGSSREFRQTGRHNREEQIDTQLTFSQAEGDEIVTRAFWRLHRNAIRYKIPVPYRYCRLKPTDIVTFTRNNVTERMQIEDISGAVPGVLEITGVQESAVGGAVQVSASTFGQGTGSQPAVTGTTSPAYPAPSVCVLFNAPTVSPGKAVFYAGAAPFDDGSWSAAELLIDRDADFERAAQFGNEAIIGKAVNSLDDYTGGGWDETVALDVDLFFGALESRPEAEVDAGANAAWYAGEFIKFVGAEKLDGFPNRWRLTKFRRGQRSTDLVKPTHTDGQTFVLMTTAIVEVVPFEADANTERTFKCVTSGFPEDAASTFTFTYKTGPTTLTAQPTETDCALAWEAGATPSAQYLEYRIAGTSSWTSVTLGTGDDTYTLEDLDPGLTYQVRILAVIDYQRYYSPVLTFVMRRDIPAPDLSGIRASDLLTRFEPVAEDGELVFDDNGDVLMEEVEN